MFTNLRMVNFKSWKDTGDVPLAPLTVLFGGNSTGKSGLLQMLLLLKQTTESNDRNLPLKTDEGYVEFGTPQEITFGDTVDMCLSVDWELPDKDPLKRGIPGPNGTQPVMPESLKLVTEIQASQQRTHVKRIRYQGNRLEVVLNRERNNQYTIRVHVDGEEAKRPQGRPRIYMRPQRCYGFSYEALRFYRNVDFLSDLVLSFEQQFQRLYYLGPLREFPQRVYTWYGEQPTDVGVSGELAIQALLAKRLQPRTAKWLRKLNLAEQFDVRPLVEGGILYEVRVKHHRRGAEVLLPDVGFGISQVLPVLVQCLYAPEHSTVILEHPDLHLHPSAQAALADFLAEVMKQRKLQLIVESHSEHFLRRLQRRTAENVFYPDEDVMLYFCSIRNGISRLTQLELDVFGRISNWPDDFFGDMDGDILEVLDKGLGKKIAANA